MKYVRAKSKQFKRYTTKCNFNIKCYKQYRKAIKQTGEIKLTLSVCPPLNGI